MNEKIYNNDNLSELDITETVIRTKALIINGDNILLGKGNNILEFPGGHLEEGETNIDCLKREIMEETGISVLNEEIEGPFFKVIYYSKDWPVEGNNRKSEIYYYVIKTNQNVDLSKTKYTEHEKEREFKIESVSLTSAIDVIKDNIKNNERNKVIAPDMIMAIQEYFKINGGNNETNK